MSRTSWLFSLLSHLETPLFRDTVAAIRSLYLRCSELREHLVNDPDYDESLLAALNLLISVSGNFYGQGEEYSNFPMNEDTMVDEVKGGTETSADDG